MPEIVSLPGWKWPFAVGDKVTARGNWGPLCCDLRIHSNANPGAVYTVHDSSAGRWIALRDEACGYGEHPCAMFGHSYFRNAGECGEHAPHWTDDGWRCARCDSETAEIPDGNHA